MDLCGTSSQVRVFGITKPAQSLAESVSKCRCLIQGCWKRAPVKIKRRVALTKGIQESRREEVRVIENVEELSPELNVKGFGDSRHPGVFEYRKVHGCETWSVKSVAARIAEDIGTELLPGGRSDWGARIGQGCATLDGRYVVNSILCLFRLARARRRDDFVDGSGHGDTRLEFAPYLIQFRYSCGPGHARLRQFFLTLAFVALRGSVLACKVISQI